MRRNPDGKSPASTRLCSYLKAGKARLLSTAVKEEGVGKIGGDRCTLLKS